MSHRWARRRLSALLDDALAPREEAELRVHLERCGRCRRELAELRAAEALLRRLPAALVPLDAGPIGTGRLALLARWASPAPRDPGWRRAGAGVLAAAAAALLAVLLAHPPGTSESLEARHGSMSHGVEVAARMPSSFLVPDLQTSGGLAYTWRR